MNAAINALVSYRNLHAGETALICGCGSSLNGFVPPDECVTIGVNDVGRQFDPDYLVVVNPRSQFSGDRFRYVERSAATALFTQLELGIRHPNVVRFRLGRRGGADWTVGDALHYTRNSPYVALQLALYMGAGRIGIIGVDFTDHHFFGRTGRHPLTGTLDAINAEYVRVQELCRKRGIEVVNLSPESRLTAFPQRSLRDFLNAPAAFPTLEMRRDNESEETMELAIQKHKPGIVGDFLDALAGTARELGHSVARNSSSALARREGITIVWNGRSLRAGGRVIYCEHGWLPRWEYQVSSRGINADSHLAPFQWNGKALTDEQLVKLETHLKSVRTGAPLGMQYMQTAAPPVAVPSDFLLVPFQMEWDTNIVRHAPSKLRRMQALIDYVSAANPPFPVVFKQHPADARGASTQLRLRVRRRQDAIWPQSHGNIHQMLKSGKCRGIVSINSNVVHDGLLWDVPAIVLGSNIWPRKGITPFLTDLPSNWSDLDRQLRDPEILACRRAYAHFVMNSQWKLSAAHDLDKVGTLLSSVKANPRPAVAARPPSKARLRPTIRVNVAAVNRGWFFEDLKKQFLRQAGSLGVEVVATEIPTRNADAWIIIRTREAGASPAPARTLVQIHDMFDSGIYKPGGQRAAIRRCAGIALTHPDQKSILEHNGISLQKKVVLCRPLGALETFRVREGLPDKFTIAWVGRPEHFRRRDVKRVGWLVDTVCRLRGDLKVVLLGEHLEETHEAIRQQGVECVYHRHDQNPIDMHPRHYAAFDALVITSTTEAGPLCLFEALAAGVPVISTRVGWAPQLLKIGENGYLVNSVDEIASALNEVRANRDAWFGRARTIRESSGGYTLEGWVSDCFGAVRQLL